MASIDKIISKVNKAKSAVNSFKGILSKLNSKNYTSALDELGERAEEAKRALETRRGTLEKSIASNKSKYKAKTAPPENYDEFRYPLKDNLDNYIVFQTRIRKPRGGTNGANIFSKKGVEIMLYVPDGLASSVSVKYGAMDIGLAARGMDSTVQSESIGETFKEAGQAVGAVVQSSLQKMRNKFTGGVTNLRGGQAVNPMQEQMLEGIDFRSFDFEYEFWPKSEEEAEVVNNIIYSFRTAMLPDTFGSIENGGNENYFNFPNIFEVEYEGPIASKLDGFLPMVCTKCDIDHFNGEKFSTFSGGQPVSSKMSLSFTEIKILSQENYQQISPKGDKSVTGMKSILDQQTQDNNNQNTIDNSGTGG